MQLIAENLASPLQAFVTSMAIGLFIGMERERIANATAGLRTFALVALLGCLFAMLAEVQQNLWLIAAGLLAIAFIAIAANFRRTQAEEVHPGFTTEIVLLLTYGLGVAVWQGYAVLSVMLTIVTTILLYLKAELKQFSDRMTTKDINSILQFSVVSLVILPILPNQDFGPYGVFNPQQIWWMVVLISGMALTGYLALRIIGTRYGAAVLGIFGGLASSTATTMMFSRHAATHSHFVPMSAIIILIANVVVMVRLGLVASIVAPSLTTTIVTIFSCGAVPGVLMILYYWRSLSYSDALPMPEVSNPTELKTAISFALLYAGVLLVAAWLQALVGHNGLFAVALVSGLTDADASALSSLRLFSLGRLSVDDVVIAVTLALLANLVFKIGLVLTIGGKVLAKQALLGLLMIGFGLALGLFFVS
ncbi:MAG: MgtC/SapB family protein [Proteobacteria bacterium]|nr:MgtC/SapB family protein [Pseudomonadota bacterium]